MVDPWGINADDIYHFMRCPRILAFKLIGVKLEKWRYIAATAKETDIPPTVIGRIGEEIIAHTLKLSGADNLAIEKVEESAKKSFVDIDAITDKFKGDINYLADISKIKSMIKSTLEGALEITEYLTSKYGTPTIFSRGRVRNTLFQLDSKPDFIVGFPDNKYIIVEVKNTKQTAKEYQIKTGFYMEVSKYLGASILMERKVGDHLELVPIDTNNVIDAIVVYPRLKKIKTAHTIEVTAELASKIMKLKHIAKNGLIPVDKNESYCQRCRYNEECRNLPKDKLCELESVSIDIPPPITVALDLAEKYHIDLDLLFHGSYLYNLYSKIIQESMDTPKLRWLYSRENMVKVLENLVDTTATEIKEALEHYETYLDIKSKPTTNIPHQVLNKCTYPSNSLKRVKDTYEKLSKLIS